MVGGLLRSISWTHAEGKFMTSTGLMRAGLLAMLVMGGAAGTAAAQDIAQDPTFGTVNLRSGFTPDPHSTLLQAGGNVDVRDTIGGTCRGMVANAPDVDLMYTAGALPLYISVTSDVDTTLVINGPDGQWYCNDDYSGVDPALTFGSPQSGLYNIWVGTYSSTVGLQAAQLHVSELQVTTVDSLPTKAPVQSGIDWTLPPLFGSATLDSGFMPDPYIVGVTAGGDLEASTLTNACWGWVTSAPTFDLNFNAGNGFDLSFTAMADEDTTLVVRRPDGTYLCNDDGYGYPNPQVTISNPQSGLYDVWVARFGMANQGEYVPAQLAISELARGPDHTSGKAPPQTTGLNWSLPPNSGSVELTSGFLPDPHVVNVVAGGDRDAGQVGDACWGYVSEAPDYDVYYDAGSYPLTFTLNSDADTVLVIRAPDGTFHCDDDGAGYPNPQVTFETPQSGLYDVWAGRFGAEGEYADAQLAVSELGLGPDGTGGDTAQTDIDWSLDPSYGTANLETGFLPDPHVVSIAAGGSQDAGPLGTGCRGMVASAPDYNLNYTAGSEYNLFISASSTADLTLVVNAPDGTWHCSDDFSGLNPAVEFYGPQSGLYNIWVGTYSDLGELPPSTLFISETEAHF